MDGHGTIGLENMEDAPDTETIFVALGGGLLGPVLRSQRRRSNPQCARAISLAAALETPKEKRGKTVCILTGGSIDADKLVEALEHSSE